MQKDQMESLMKAEVNKRISERLSGACAAMSELEGAQKAFNQSSHQANISHVPVLRLRVVDINSNPKCINKGICTGTVNIWRPTEEMVNNLNESKRFRFFNLTANIVRDGEVQFRATKATRFQEISKCEGFNALSLPGNIMGLFRSFESTQ